MLQLGAISIMPHFFDLLRQGVTQKAFELKKANLQVWNPRDWTTRPYCQVDDTPYGGGPGMIMRYEPLDAAIRFAKRQMPVHTRCVYLSPQGKTLMQQDLNQLAQMQQPLLFISGRYEGIDERVIETHVDEEWSIGDFVLSGGEFPTMVFMDALLRLLPGVLGHPRSAACDSFMQGYLDHPHYTKPAQIAGKAVPEILMNGNHQEIDLWRRMQSLKRTWLKKPALMEQLTLTKQEQSVLDAFRQEQNLLLEGENS